MKRSGSQNKSRRKRGKAMAMKKAEIIKANHEEEEEAMPMPLPCLPGHLHVEILYKLPVKSLFRFKCVSKPWRSLISEPHFMKTHLNQSLTNSSIQTHRRILIATSCTPHRLYTASFGSSEYDIAVANMDFLFQKNPHRECQIIGSCNGLICMLVEFYYSVEVYVFNLSTREAKRIPDFRGFRFSNFPSDRVGFGYDNCSDDYKVVAIGDNSIYVYSLRIGSWTKVVQDVIPIFNFRVSVANGTQQLNGALHWLCWKNDSDEVPPEIAAFSLVDEKLWKIPLPTSFTNFRKARLGVFEGCLCILPSCCDDEFWVMKEYGVMESWTTLEIKVPFSNMLKPLGSPTRNIDEALLLIDETKLVLYNTREGTNRYLVMNDERFDATIYVDSFLSPSM